MNNIHPTDKITHAREEALQELADELEQIAEGVRVRGMRGRRIGSLVGLVAELRIQTERLEELVGNQPLTAEYFPLK